MAPSHPRRTGIGSVLTLRAVIPWLANWLRRVTVALVFVIGVVATGGVSPQSESEAEVETETGEDGELAEQTSVQAHTGRRTITAKGPPARELREPRPPRVLAPAAQAPPQRGHHPIRRTAPPDDEDDDQALARVARL